MAVVLLRCGYLEVLSCFSYTSPGSVQLLDSVGRLRPAEDPEGEAALHFALHLAMRGLLPKARESGVAVGLRHNKGETDPNCEGIWLKGQVQW